MAQIALLVEYCGSYYKGWQFQPGCRTVQDDLHKAIELVLGTKISALYSAGRTDAGVHAYGQVVSFRSLGSELDLNRLTASLNGLLRGKIAILKSGLVSEEFHPRKSSINKEYRYRVLLRQAPPTNLMANQVWHITAKIDLQRLESDCLDLIGVHDFSSFRSKGCLNYDPVKTIYELKTEQIDSELVFSIVGNGFLKQMVRIIVGTIIDRARGKIQVTIPEIIAKKDRASAGITAPPQGLSLYSVGYLDHELQWLTRRA